MSLTRAAIPVTSASSEPQVGQKQGGLELAEDAPPAPNYMADKTPLKRIGVMSTRDLRNEYYRDPALPILLGDEVLKKCLRLDQGLPPGTLSISEDGKLYTMEKPLELSVWPPKTSAPVGEAGVDQPTVFGGDGGTSSGWCPATPQ
ncbi:MAG: hypothetical protein VKN56_01885 [Cyanobacteriota bacterium]|nr:hypothetical protein [Cyanobacteriota bacterium]